MHAFLHSLLSQPATLTAQCRWRTRYDMAAILSFQARFLIDNEGAKCGSGSVCIENSKAMLQAARMLRCRTLPGIAEAGAISADTAALAPPLLMVRVRLRRYRAGCAQRWCSCVSSATSPSERAACNSALDPAVQLCCGSLSTLDPTIVGAASGQPERAVAAAGALQPNCVGGCHQRDGRALAVECAGARARVAPAAAQDPGEGTPLTGAPNNARLTTSCVQG